MSLSLRAKQSLYHSLGQLLRSGVPLAAALNSLAQTSRGAQRRLIQRLNDAISAGKTMGEAFGVLRPETSELEIGVVAACEKSGRLEFGMAQLAEYHGAFAAAREDVLKRCAYPVFVLHFGILVFPLKTLVAGGGVAGYLREVVGTLALVYALVLLLAAIIPVLRNAGAKSGAMDSLLRLIPLLGKVRRDFATARFCVTYGMQLDAGINVIDALQAGGRASFSGLVSQASRRAVSVVREGGQVGAHLASSGAFPEPMVRSFCVGEQTGKLDAELVRMAAEYQASALRRLETAAEWLSRMIYLTILLFIGWGIISFYKGYLDGLNKIMDGL